MLLTTALRHQVSVALSALNPVVEIWLRSSFQMTAGSFTWVSPYQHQLHCFGHLACELHWNQCWRQREQPAIRDDGLNQKTNCLRLLWLVKMGTCRLFNVWIDTLQSTNSSQTFLSSGTIWLFSFEYVSWMSESKISAIFIPLVYIWPKNHTTYHISSHHNHIHQCGIKITS